MKKTNNKNRFVLTAVLMIVLFHFELMIISIKNPVSAKDQHTIVINPGHSQGYDPGTIGVNGIPEADINAQMASKLGNLLQKNGYDVYLTHPVSGFSGKTLMTNAEADSLIRITEKINAVNPDLTISIHCDSGSFTSSGYGFYWSSYKPGLDMTDIYSLYGFWADASAAYFDRTPCSAALQSLKFAECMKDSFITGLGDQMPAHPYDIHERDDCVTAQTNSPCVLIETAFLSNEHDADFISNDKNQDKMVSCIQKAVDRFFSEQTPNHHAKNMTGWHYINDNWYDLDPTKNNTGWQYINGFWCYLDPDFNPTQYYYIETGGMAVSPWVNKGRYYVSSEEFWADKIKAKAESYSENTTIMGKQIISKEKMINYFKKNADFDTNFYNMDLDYFVQNYIDEGYAEGVRPEIAFAQMIHETNFLNYGGSIQRNQLNFANLGNSSFSNIKFGVRAQIQHLKAYASSEPLTKYCFDPIFNLVTRSSATTIGDLGNGNWSADPQYAQKLLNHLKKMQ